MPKLFSVPLLFAAFFGGHIVYAQTPPSPILDRYIHQGLESNLALKQKNFDLQKAGLDLQRAKAAFFPQAGFSSQYTLADGGRTQSIPVGDLLNNVYSTLNKLTGSNQFPQVANQSIQFLPNDYHDTKMEISMPLFNEDLYYNRQVSKALIDTRRADADIYKRELVKSIREAYYQYLQTGKAVDIYIHTLDLVHENLRVSEKLVENHVATREIVLRAKAQVSQVESSLIDAKDKFHNAAAYFNFLLNRPLDTFIDMDSAMTPGSGASPTPAAALPPAALPGDREELAQLRSVRQVMETNLRWDRSYLVPKLSAFYDIGFQGFGFRFDNTQFYQLAGMQLVWPLFSSNANKYKIREARIDMASTGARYDELNKQLILQVQTAQNNYASAVEALQPLSDEVLSATETYRLTERRFEEGQALQIELIDARTQMTGAQLRYSLGQLSVLDRSAELERVTASYKF